MKVRTNGMDTPYRGLLLKLRSHEIASRASVTSGVITSPFITWPGISSERLHHPLRVISPFCGNGKGRAITTRAPSRWLPNNGVL